MGSYPATRKSNACQPGCTCKKHTKQGKSCDPGCTCNRHLLGPMPEANELHTKTIHSRIHAARGKASEQNCVDCNNQACDWTHISGTDRGDIMNYVPRCRSCHTLVDHNHIYTGGVKTYG